MTYTYMMSETSDYVIFEDGEAVNPQVLATRLNQLEAVVDAADSAESLLWHIDNESNYVNFSDFRASAHKVWVRLQSAIDALGGES